MSGSFQRGKQQVDWVESTKTCFEAGAVLYTSHARREMTGEPFGRISEEEVSEAVLAGELIEEYPEDTPYASALLFGTTKASRPLHIVCAYDDEGSQTIIITVYQPDPGRWEDYRRRKR